MPVANVTGALVANLPKSLTVEWTDATGTVTDTFTGIEWSAEDDDIEHDVPIYGKFRRILQDPRRTDPSHRFDDFTRSVTGESITFTSGQDVYQVLERDIAAVDQLLATVGGTPNTPLVEGTDFEIHQTSDYSTNDAIKFLDGGTKPDSGTQFTIDYQHTLMSQRQATTVFLNYRGVLHVEAGGAGTITGPTSGYEYMPTELGELLVEAVSIELDRLRGKQLVAGLKMHQAVPLPVAVPGSTGRSARFFVDWRMSRDREFERAQVEKVGKVDTTVTDDQSL